MSIPAQQQSLQTRVFGTNPHPVVVGFTIMALTAVVGASIGRFDVALLSPAVGGLAGGFQFGKNTFAAGGVGFRIGITAAVMIWVGSVVLLILLIGLDSLGVALGELGTSVTNAVWLFSLRGIGWIPVSGILGMIGSAVGTNLRRMLVPHEYNPPLH
ncbi:hypothetical protein [Halorhabdus sp. BNX81]|uniref:hypothetical protein n=1 Tax=Halorhabdus sp. BNX81 TaxID=2980181 RepID=UPI0023DD1496|nr:hypothetical protein [Halorhabdus sp. BNX81]